MNKFRLVIIALALLNVACVSSGQSQQVEPPGIFASVDQMPDKWISQNSELADVKAGWVSQYQDKTLENIIEEAINHNPSLQILSARIMAAKSLVRKSKAALMPSLELISTGSGSDGFDNDSSLERLFGAGLNVNWETNLWGRLRVSNQADIEGYHAAIADEVAAHHLLATQVAESYFLAIEAQMQTEVAQATLEALLKTLGFIEVQYDRGLRSGQDIELIRADVDSTRAIVTDSLGAQRDALRALEVLIGRYPSAQDFIEAKLPAIPTPPSAGIPADLLLRRPDILSAINRLRATTFEVSSAEAARLPTLNLGGVISANSTDVNSLFDPTSMAWSFIASLTSPLFDSGSRRADIEIRKAQLIEAIAEFQQLAIVAFKEVEGELDRGQVLSDRKISVDRALDAARKALGFTQTRYENGDGDLLDVLSIQQRVSALQSTSVSLQRAQLVQYALLSKALGGDWNI